MKKTPPRRTKLDRTKSRWGLGLFWDTSGPVMIFNSIAKDEDQAPFIKFRTHQIPTAQVPPSYCMKRQETRLFFLGHTDEFLHDLVDLTMAQLEITPALPKSMYDEFQDKWQVGLRYLPEDPWWFEKKRQPKKWNTPWIWDRKNLPFRLIDPSLSDEETGQSHVIDESTKDRVMFLQIPDHANKDELVEYVKKIRIKEPKDSYITTDRKTALQVFRLRQYENLSFVDIAKKMFPQLTHDALKARAETHRKLYKKIVESILDLPLNLRK